MPLQRLPEEGLTPMGEIRDKIMDTMWDRPSVPSGAKFAAPVTAQAVPMTREQYYDAAEAELAAPGAIVVYEGPTPPPVAATNPKEGAGAQKPPTWSVFPRWVILAVGRVMQIGAAKYDAFNYREAPVQAMTYVDAIERHMQLWQDGEDIDDETGESHLASVIASCSILMDTQALGNMGDNRQKTGLVRKKLDELTERAKTIPLPPKNPNAPSMRKAAA